MIDTLSAARVLLTQYGQQLRTVREHVGLSCRELADDSASLWPSYISEIERGHRCPTTEQAAELDAWMARFPDVTQPFTAGPSVNHARMSDPVSSDIAVKSIAADKPLGDKILAVARSFGTTPFDDTDLSERIPEHDRNVIAKARLILMTERVLIRPCNPLDTRKHRVPLPDSPLYRCGLIERTRHGQTRPTIHFIFTGDTQT